MKQINMLLTGIALLLFSSCAKDPVAATSTIIFQLKAANSAVNGANINWTIGSAGVGATKIEVVKPDGSSAEFRTDPNVQLDLFGMSNVSNLNITGGTYRKVEFRSELSAFGGKPSLRMEGTFTAGGIATPIVLEIGTPVTVKSQIDSIIIAPVSSNYTAQTTINLPTLTTDVTEAELKVADRVSGKIILSASLNIATYNKVLTNLGKVQLISFK